MTDKNSNHGLIIDFTRNEENVAELIKELRRCGLDTVTAFDENHPFWRGLTWYERYSACIIIKKDKLVDDELKIYNETSEHIPTLEVEKWNDININDVENFLLSNNCKNWQLTKIIEDIIERIAWFLPKEIPIIDLSESLFSVIAAVIVKKAINDRAERFVFYDRGIYYRDKIDKYLKALEEIGIHTEYIDIKTKFMPEPDYTNRKVMDDYLMYTYEIHEKPLLELYGDSIGNNGLVSTSSKDYTGILYDCIHRYTGIWKPYYAEKSITPCDRFFISEFDEIAHMLGLTDKIIELTKSLFEDRK